jgi:hypothetical protein
MGQTLNYHRPSTGLAVKYATVASVVIHRGHDSANCPSPHEKSKGAVRIESLPQPLPEFLTRDLGQRNRVRAWRDPARAGTPVKMSVVANL